MPYITTGNSVDIEYVRDENSRPVITALKYREIRIPLPNPLGLYNVLRDLVEEAKENPNAQPQ